MKHDLNSRQFALYNLLKNNPDRRFQLVEIPKELPEFYRATSGTNFHNTGARRRISADIQAINNSDIIQKVIIKDSHGIKLASEEEFKQYISVEFASIFRRLERTRKKAEKGGLKGQMKIPMGKGERDTVEPFTDSINRLKAARLAAGLKLTEAVRELQKVNRWVDVPLLSKMENGYCKPTEEVLLRMAQIYGISPSLLRDGYFIPNEENERKNPFANDENTQ